MSQHSETVTAGFPAGFPAGFRRLEPAFGDCHRRLRRRLKLMQSASRRWRALNGSGLLAEVIKGTVYVDGIEQEDAA